MDTVIRMPRDKPYDWHKMFGLLPLATVFSDKRAQRIQVVDLLRVPILECCTEDGTCMTGLEVIGRFNTVEWLRFRPLDAAFHAACGGVKGILNPLIDRVGMRQPYFFLDSTVFGSRFQEGQVKKDLAFFDDEEETMSLADIYGDGASTLMLYQDCDGFCRHMLVPLKMRRGPNAFVLANG